MWVLKKKILMGTLIPRNTTRPWRYFKIQSNNTIGSFFQFYKKSTIHLCHVHICIKTSIDQCCNSIFSASYIFRNNSFSFIFYLGSFQSRVL